MKKILFLLMTLLVITQSYSQNRTKGYRGFTDLQAHFGIAESDVSSMYGITTTHGYQFNPHIFVGAGVGYSSVNDSENHYSTSITNDYIIPFYVDFRANILKSKVSPYFDLKLGGHTKYIEDEIGYYINPSIGASFMISNKLALNVGASALIWEYSKKDDAPYGAAGLTIGLEF